MAQKMMKIILRGPIYRWERGSDFILDVGKAEYEKNPRKVYEVPDNSFWRSQLSFPDATRLYDLAVNVVNQVVAKEEKAPESSKPGRKPKENKEI